MLTRAAAGGFLFLAPQATRLGRRPLPPGWRWSKHFGFGRRNNDFFSRKSVYWRRRTWAVGYARSSPIHHQGRHIDPLSGGGASVGEVGLKTFQYLADQVNAKGGIQGKKVEIVPLHNKTNTQES